MPWVEQTIGAIDRRGYLYCSTCADQRDMPREEYVYFSALVTDDSCEACGTIIEPKPLIHR